MIAVDGSFKGSYVSHPTDVPDLPLSGRVQSGQPAPHQTVQVLHREDPHQEVSPETRKRKQTLFHNLNMQLCLKMYIFSKWVRMRVFLSVSLWRTGDVFRCPPPHVSQTAPCHPEINHWPQEVRQVVSAGPERVLLRAHVLQDVSRRNQDCEVPAQVLRGVGEFLETDQQIKFH